MVLLYYNPFSHDFNTKVYKQINIINTYVQKCTTQSSFLYTGPNICNRLYNIHYEKERDYAKLFYFQTKFNKLYYLVQISLYYNI